MNLRIITELEGQDKSCCFELWEKGKMVKCGCKNVGVTAGKNKYLCKEHTENAAQGVKRFQSTVGNDITMRRFFEILGEKYE